MKLLKYIIIIALVIPVITSCQSMVYRKKNLIGEYVYKTNKIAFNFEYRLRLNADTTFNLQISNQSCHGIWTTLSKDETILKCDVVNNLEPLSSSYLFQREYIIRILDEDSLILTIYNPYFPSIPNIKSIRE